MDRAEFRTVLEPLVLALRADFDLPTWTVYFRALEDVPLPLLMGAIDRAAKTATFMPKPGELRAFAEGERQALIKAHPWTPCCECEDHPRFQKQLVDGVERLARCPCLARHQAKLAELGVGSTPLALPPAREVADWTQASELV